MILIFVFFTSVVLKDKTEEPKIIINNPNYQNDSILLSEYQQAMSILIKTDTATANKFSRVMEQINTGQ
jgi:hypothetical protein